MNERDLNFIRSQYTETEYANVQEAANGVPLASFQKYLVMERVKEVLRRGKNN